MRLICDIGGTNIRMVCAENGKFVGDPLVEKTPSDFSEAVLLIVSLAKKASGREKISEAVFALAGVYDKDKDTLTWSPNLPEWMGKNIKKPLEKELKIPIRIFNDADLAGVGEAIFGVGKNHKIVAYFTVSTGLGGTRIVDGKIDAASVGFEPGRQIIEKETTLESLVSGSSMKKRFGKEPEKIKDEKVWLEAAENLSVGLFNSSLFWSPDIIVLGGPLILQNQEIPFDKIKEKTHHLLEKIFYKIPEIKKSALGEFSGLWGGLVV